MSCSNELDIADTIDKSSGLKTKSFNVENEECFQVIDGCLKFKDYDSYIVINKLLIDKTDEELKEWKSSFDYISLYDEYQRVSPLEYIEEKDYDIDMNQDSINNNVKSSMHATLLNSRGMLMIGDTILKVKDEYTYTIKNGNMDAVRIIEEGGDVSSLDYVERSKHSVDLKTMTRNWDRTPVFELSGSRREYAQFNVSVSGSGSSVFIAEIRGRAQKKKLWWGVAFDDEIVWGKITVTGSYYVDNAYYPLNMTPTIQENVCVVSCKRLLVDGVLDRVSVNVLNEFCKTAAQGDLSYMNNYILSK